MSAVEQLAFDFDALTPPPRRPVYSGRAPVRFTSGFHTIEELGEAFAEWIERNGSFGSHVFSHMWVPPQFHTAPEGHTFATTTADLRHTPDSLHGYGKHCECVGTLLYRAQCDTCRAHWIGRWNDVVEAWHDLHWPGWRDLPVMPPIDGEPAEASQKRVKRWAETNYPSAWQVPGVPIVSERRPMGTRDVPGRSPWGGFDIAQVVAA